MKKLLLLGGLLLGAGYSASAREVPLKTSCGKTITLQSEDYKNSQDMIEDVIAIDKAICRN